MSERHQSTFPFQTFSARSFFKVTYILEWARIIQNKEKLDDGRSVRYTYTPPPTLQIYTVYRNRQSLHTGSSHSGSSSTY